MTDVVDRATRRRMMSGIRGKNTGPEMIVRRGLHARGFRYRLHDGGLPGKPDLVFVRYNAAMFVNGCFWHGHGCHLFKWPSSRARFWRQKISANRKRDAETLLALRKAGWRVAIVWECALKGRLRRSASQVVEDAGEWLRSGGEFREIGGRTDGGV